MPSLDEILQAKQARIDELHRLQPGRTALLVVDMQRGFLEPGAALEVPPGRDIVPNLRSLVDACRRQRVPVVFRLQNTAEVIAELDGLANRSG